MSDEKLTAEDRAGVVGPLQRKLLRLYDAALARAEAAEASTQYANGWLAQWVSRSDVAESRLAEATALLRATRQAVRDAANNRNWPAVLAAISERSATPAQSAEPVRCGDAGCDGHGAQAAESEKRRPYDQGWLDGSAATAKELLAGREQDDRLTAAVEALSAKFLAVGSEHPDTIALAECRAELEGATDAKDEAEIRLAESTVAQDELRRRVMNQRASLDFPRIEDVVEREQLKKALESARAERDTLARVVGQALVVQTLDSDEELNGLKGVSLLLRDAMIAARAERDTALGEREACEKHLSIVIESRDTARARIAELEDEARRKDAYYQTQGERITELETERNGLHKFNAELITDRQGDFDAIRKGYTDRIAQAVAELEKVVAFLPKHLVHKGVFAALEVLK